MSIEARGPLPGSGAGAVVAVGAVVLGGFTGVVVVAWSHASASAARAIGRSARRLDWADIGSVRTLSARASRDWSRTGAPMRLRGARGAGTLRRMTSDVPGALPRVRIQLWSGPRNVSTALMYSFAQRSDTRIVDEPLYAHYLRVSGAEHPGRDEVLRAQDDWGDRVVREVILGSSTKPVVFFKQMAHHLVDLDHAFLARTENVLLTRDPREMLPSLAENLERPTLRDTGYAAQTDLLDELERIGQDPPVLEARELLLDPEGVLTELCRRLKLPFERAMLAWEPGARAEDGVWAPHWYANVHRSRGFDAYRPKRATFPARLEPLYEQCRPHYERLHRRAIRARTR